MRNLVCLSAWGQPRFSYIISYLPLTAQGVETFFRLVTHSASCPKPLCTQGKTRGRYAAAQIASWGIVHSILILPPFLYSCGSGSPMLNGVADTTITTNLLGADASTPSGMTSSPSFACTMHSARNVPSSSVDVKAV